MNNRVASVHENKKPFECRICDKMMEREHSNMKFVNIFVLKRTI